MIDVGHFDGFADLHGAAVGLFLAGEHAKQRGLTCAVWPDDANDSGLWQCERQVFNQQPIPESFRQVGDLDDGIAKAFAGRDHDFEPVVVDAVRFRFGLQLVVGGEAGLAFGLASLWRHAHPFQFLLEGALAGGLSFFFLCQTGLLLFKPTRVVAFEGEALALVEFENPLRHVVKEVAIVGDGDHGPRIFLQVAFEPSYRFRIEMVRRFIEQQQIWARQQQTA